MEGKGKAPDQLVVDALQRRQDRSARGSSASIRKWPCTKAAVTPRTRQATAASSDLRTAELAGGFRPVFRGLRWQRVATRVGMMKKFSLSPRFRSAPSLLRRRRRRSTAAGRRPAVGGGAVAWRRMLAWRPRGRPPSTGGYYNRRYYYPRYSLRVLRGASPTTHLITTRTVTTALRLPLRVPVRLRRPYVRSGDVARGLGGVQIKDAPKHAQVFADGYYAGTVDDFDGMFQHLDLDAGAHHIEIRAQGQTADRSST